MCDEGDNLSGVQSSVDDPNLLLLNEPRTENEQDLGRYLL